jgi:quinohemoprotein ethanol dehydrogenase
VPAPARAEKATSASTPCHGGNAISAGLIPDLRYRITELAAAWRSIAIDGAFADRGLPAWRD